MKKYFDIFLSAILAGICIGLGSTVFLRIKDTFNGGNIVGALLFTVGLFTICTRKYNLFTGKVCYIFENRPDYLFSLIIIWIGNLCGCCLLAVIENATNICGDKGINVVAASMVESKMSSSLISLFILGVICNIFIYIAVDGYIKNSHELGKYLSLFFGVSVFILCGTEHSVADMYYWAVSGMLRSYPCESLLRILVVSLGNVVGGISFPVIERWLCKK